MIPYGTSIMFRLNSSLKEGNGRCVHILDELSNGTTGSVELALKEFGKQLKK